MRDAIAIAAEKEQNWAAVEAYGSSQEDLLHLRLNP